MLILGGQEGPSCDKSPPIHSNLKLSSALRGKDDSCYL